MRKTPHRAPPCEELDPATIVFSFFHCELLHLFLGKSTKTAATIPALFRSTHTHTHTDTHPFNGPFSGTTQVSRYQKVKPIWILLKQETVSGSGISWAVCKSAPCSRQITTPAPHPSVFTGRMPFLPPNQQRHSTEGQFSAPICTKSFVGWGFVPDPTRAA